MYDSSDQSVVLTFNYDIAFILLIILNFIMVVSMFFVIPFVIHFWYQAQSSRNESKLKVLLAWFGSTLPLLIGLILFTVYVSNARMDSEYNFYSSMQVQGYKLVSQDSLSFGGFTKYHVSEVSVMVSVQWETNQENENNFYSFFKNSTSQDLCTSTTIYSPCTVKALCKSHQQCTEEDRQAAAAMATSCIQELLENSIDWPISFESEDDGQYKIKSEDSSTMQKLPTVALYGNSEICHARYKSSPTSYHCNQLLVLAGAFSIIGLLLIPAFVLKTIFTEDGGCPDNDTECSSIASLDHEYVVTRKKEDSVTSNESETSSTGDIESTTMEDIPRNTDV